MPDADPAPDPSARATHGGARPGAGGPSGPRPETLARLARLREIAHLDEAGEDITHLSNLDLVQLQVWRLWNSGRCKDAAELAFRLLPYHHSRKPNISITRAEAPDAAEPEPEPPPPARPSTPRLRAPRRHDTMNELRLDRLVAWEKTRRKLRPEIPSRIPREWREEVESRIVHEVPDPPD